jgi:short-subunit dehydrogenase
MKMNKLGWAIVTGASSGIGRELARIHASKGGSVILVARRGDELMKLSEELRSNYVTDTRIVVMDLTKQGASRELYDRIVELDLEIDYLMNNAGVGGYGKFYNRSIEKEHEMIMLNVMALMELTHYLLPGMIQRKKGKILNTSSTAGFVPGPYMANYYATKAYVNSFSLALSQEVRQYGISVTSLCPGPVNTEFEETAGMGGSGLFKFASTAKATAEKGYRAMMKGKREKITAPLFGVMLKAFVPFTPNSIVLKVIEKIQKVKD